MHAIRFKYRPIAWLPYQKEINTTHPESWNELTPLQFEEVVHFINNPKKEEGDIILLTNALLSLTKPLASFPKEIYDLQQFINDDSFFSWWIIKTLGTDVILNGPDDSFKTMSIGQFAYVDTFFIQYVRDASKGPAQQHLHKFIASLYINSKDFDPDKIDGLVKYIIPLAEKTKTAILFNYMIMRQWIMDKYCFVFPKPDPDNEDTLRLAQGKREPHSTWREYIRSLVNGDYVNEEKILKTSLHTILYDHNETIKQQKRQKK